MKNDIYDEVRNLDRPSTLAFDGWKNARRSKVFNVILLDGERAIFINSFEHDIIESEKLDANYLSQKILPIIIDLLAEGIVRIACTAFKQGNS